MKKILVITSALGGLTVILGAFGAHGIKPLISEANIEVYKTAVSYQFFHVLAIIGCGILYQLSGNKLFKIGSYAFLLGILLFSGSLYLLSTREATGLNSLAILGPITPLGGLSFITGWVMMMMGIIKEKNYLFNQREGFRGLCLLHNSK
ncbi:MAG: DUF423 domain-containing protein [Candidatus Parvibacillus calidus]|nr:MAG: DUF423 domain-containing protein [Candidatus Parvibacillus calidus]